MYDLSLSKCHRPSVTESCLLSLKCCFLQDGLSSWVCHSLILPIYFLMWQTLHPVYVPQNNGVNTIQYEHSISLALLTIVLWTLNYGSTVGAPISSVTSTMVQRCMSDTMDDHVHLNSVLSCRPALMQTELGLNRVRTFSTSTIQNNHMTFPNITHEDNVTLRCSR